MIKFLLPLFICCSLHAQIVLNGATLRGATIGTTNATGGGGGVGTAFITSGHGSTTRHDFTGVVGYKITVGASNITVTDLGRIVVSGNTATHVVYLEDTGGNVLASCTVATAGGIANTYVYNSITPTVLSASGGYWIVTAEVNNGDDWYNDNADLTSTGDATVETSGFASGPNVNPTASISGLRGFGPPNFKYTVP